MSSQVTLLADPLQRRKHRSLGGVTSVTGVVGTSGFVGMVRRGQALKKKS
jgi:hypothetical protein